jgi:hypothetical protein
MSSTAVIEPMSALDEFLGSSARSTKTRPNVVDVGAWLNRSRSMRLSLAADYIPRHRASGPAL